MKCFDAIRISLQKQNNSIKLLSFQNNNTFDNSCVKNTLLAQLYRKVVENSLCVFFICENGLACAF